MTHEIPSTREKAISVWLTLIIQGQITAAESLLDQINKRNWLKRWPKQK